MCAEDFKRGRLVILAGPSCVGKSPLYKALRRFYPDLAAELSPVVLYNSRSPRPGEEDAKDYHFRRRDEIEVFRHSERHVVLEVRGDMQALDLDELDRTLQHGDAFFEGNPFVGRLLQTDPRLAEVDRLSMFVTPLSRDEILELREEDDVSLQSLITDVMRRKLLRRMCKQKGEISGPDLEEVEWRCGSAYKELGMASDFSFVIPNHDGEDSENWDAFYYPLGDARRTLQTVAAVLKGEDAPEVETREPGLLG